MDSVNVYAPTLMTEPVMQGHDLIEEQKYNIKNTRTANSLKNKYVYKKEQLGRSNPPFYKLIQILDIEYRMYPKYNDKYNVEGFIYCKYKIRGGSKEEYLYVDDENITFYLLNDTGINFYIFVEEEEERRNSYPNSGGRRRKSNRGKTRRRRTNIRRKTRR